MLYILYECIAAPLLHPQPHPLQHFPWKQILSHSGFRSWINLAPCVCLRTLIAFTSAHDATASLFLFFFFFFGNLTGIFYMTEEHHVLTKNVFEVSEVQEVFISKIFKDSHTSQGLLSLSLIASVLVTVSSVTYLMKKSCWDHFISRTFHKEKVRKYTHTYVSLYVDEQENLKGTYPTVDSE